MDLTKLTPFEQGMIAGVISFCLRRSMPSGYKFGSDEWQDWMRGWARGFHLAEQALGAAGMVGGEIPSPVGAVGAPVSPHKTPAAPAPTLSVEPEALFDE